MDPRLEEGLMTLGQILWCLLIGSASGVITTSLGSAAIRRDERKRLEEKMRRRQ